MANFRMSVIFLSNAGITTRGFMFAKFNPGAIQALYGTNDSYNSDARAVMTPWMRATTLAQSRRATTILNGGRRYEHDFCEGTDAEGQPA